jgi:nitrogen fixation/metabolism regulation signal transduction histidine kinase
MKSLRNKIFIFVAFLLILPAIPLSFIISELLDKSYQIGVNEKVENALEGALNISSDFYNQQKEIIKEYISQAKSYSENPENIIYYVNKKLPASETQFIDIKNLNLLDETIIPLDAINKFLARKKDQTIWPIENHTKLLVLTRIKTKYILMISQPLPASFQKSAKAIQEVNQVYKTLGFVKSNIQNSFLFTFIFVYGVGLIITLFVSYWFSKKITHPVDELKKAAAEIGQGNFKYRVQLKGKDELANLGNSFNTMAVELNENQRKIIELEKMNTWQQLARRLAHEIKNPLTPIQLMSQQIRDSYTGDDIHYRNMLLESCQIIEQEVESLKVLVKEFSDFARLPKINPALNNLSDLIRSVARLYQSAEIETNLSKNNIELNFDYDYIKRVLINLVDNALAANNSNEPILIDLKQSDKIVELSIEDKGTGISPENLQRIFEPYYSTKKSGVGLGLSIVKKIVEEHGGKIEVESDLGQRTRFIIKFN